MKNNKPSAIEILLDYPREKGCLLKLMKVNSGLFPHLAKTIKTNKIAFQSKQ